MTSVHQQFQVTVHPAPASCKILLDDFEGTTIREASPGGVLLWGQYTSGAGGNGFASIDTEDAQSGSQCLKIELYSEQFYAQFLPHVPNGVANMHEYVQPPDKWRTDYFNRMQFWIKVPPGQTPRDKGKASANLGTYCRKSDGNRRDQEDGGGHWYHNFNLEDVGPHWYQLLLDTHPNHRRGANGQTEHGDQEYVTGEPGVWNYFDALTRFYLNVDRTNPIPSTWRLDNFRLYRETADEEIDKVYSLNGIHIADEQRTIVKWMRHKNENYVNHEVCYSHEDIHEHGWDSAIPAPGGLCKPLGWQGYNGMEYETTEIVPQCENLYIGIKPENSNRFRQIILPVA